MFYAVLVLAVCGLLTTERTSRIATYSYAAIYLSGTLLFRLMALDRQMPFDSYLLTMATMSSLQVAIYTRLQPRPGILAAMACEVLLLATYLVAYCGVPEFLSYRVTIWQWINFAAILALVGDWWQHGITRLDNRHKWLWGAGSSGGTTRAGSVAASQQAVGMDKGALP